MHAFLKKKKDNNNNVKILHKEEKKKTHSPAFIFFAGKLAISFLVTVNYTKSKINKLKKKSKRISKLPKA